MPRIPWADAASLRKLAEESVTRGATVRARRDMAHARLVHELEVHAAELELQNEALRETQREIEASRAAYRNLFDLAPVAYVSVDRSGRIDAANGQSGLASRAARGA